MDGHDYERFLRTRANAYGEWSISDPRLGYRICTFHERFHGGPHIHQPPHGPVVFRVEVQSLAEAKALMAEYGATALQFDLYGLAEVLTQWKSKSRKP